ncbi:MAG TPA: helix-turn-helix transcriptional regulator [Tissierellales bacterium]|nr:helix-turn-helix transcriptional regulator [Tissierellales bacterium]
MKVKEYRIIKGFTQNELSELIGITQQTYSKKERGERSFTLDEVKKLKKILNISYEELFGED